MIISGSINYTYSGRKRKVKRVKKIAPTTFNAKRSATPSYADIRMAEDKKYASRPESGGIAARKESQQYTGTYVKGIGTMHKSNAVPITNSEHMKDIAKMRR